MEDFGELIRLPWEQHKPLQCEAKRGQERAGDQIQ